MSLRIKVFVALIALVTLAEAGLGVWQWRRMDEKRAMLAGIEAGAKAAPTPYSEARFWQRVSVTGRYLHDKTAYVRSSRPEPGPGQRNRAGAPPASGFGVLVMTPFVTRVCNGGGHCTLTTLYVNRGFVPTPPNGRIPLFERPEEPVTLTGYLRPSEHPTLFQPANDPARGVFFHRSIEAMAQRAGLFRAEDPAASPYDRFVDREASPDERAPPFGIVAQEFIAAIPNNHFQYALTWWGLALTTIFFGIAFMRSRRPRAGDPD